MGRIEPIEWFLTSDFPEKVSRGPIEEYKVLLKLKLSEDIVTGSRVLIRWEDQAGVMFKDSNGGALHVSNIIEWSYLPYPPPKGHTT
jgi:hypothetical protein